MSVETLPTAGSWVRDLEGDGESLFVVLEVVDERADECYVPAIDRVVAEWPPNREYQSDDRVARIVPTDPLTDTLGLTWTVSDVLDADESGALDDAATVYHYPVSRLEVVA